MSDLTVIALELLEKYKEAQSSVIYEYSTNINKELSDLESECDLYIKAIGLLTKIVTNTTENHVCELNIDMSNKCWICGKQL